MSRIAERTWTPSELVERIREDVKTGDWGPVELMAIELTSPQDAWPPIIRLDFRTRGQDHRWQSEWVPPEGASLEAAASLWVGIVGAHMCEHGYL